MYWTEVLTCITYLVLEIFIVQFPRHSKKHLRILIKSLLCVQQKDFRQDSQFLIFAVIVICVNVFLQMVLMRK